ncbi:hypothetical protein [Cupriavidus consociatus]|uniref:hypothetical protein n=1 Tax=Cupriavidus consociatus TaxID=2821357 RepID=UPI001AE7280E|nr:MULTISPECIES: hypothetical protein [unclassified Cupriavidus]MBP0619679.1 hypothetical protein [Cupriavidus sp. LEh25]MDK2656330.1 hypothetical protein [Cupriavidus sp. LEh21]
MVMQSLHKALAPLPLLLCVVFVTAGQVSHGRERMLSSSRSTTHAVTVGTCKFRFKDSLGGRIREHPQEDIPSATYNAEMKRPTLPKAVIVDFLCDTKGQNKYCQRFSGIGKKDGHWVQHPDPDYRAPPEANFTVREIKSSNASGATRTIDDTIGNEEDRVRYLSFCLVSPDGNVLIGGAVIDSLYGNHRSTEPEVRKLLESIEFIENR